MTRVVLVVLACATMMVGCAEATETPFARDAGDAASGFAAAATTLEYARDGRLTTAYARGSFVNYVETLQGLDQRLEAAEGAPAGDELTRLLELFRAAKPAVERPCLAGDCGWEQQVRTLRAASEAFSKAAKQ